MIDEIPYLRLRRDATRRAALEALDRGDRRAALGVLLRDQDDWAPVPPPTSADVDGVLDDVQSDAGTLRDAMAALRLGPVADYFAYRWSDPTFLSGLALLDAHLPQPLPAEPPSGAPPVFELACGIGHYCRELERRGIAAIGGDVVFAKLFLARHYVAPLGRYVCFDAADPFPLADRSSAAAFCHDAFYFLPLKPRVAAELRRVVGPTAPIIVGHAHNAAVDNVSAGAPLDVDEYAALFQDPVLYDDRELTRAVIEDRPPRAEPTRALRDRAAVAIVSPTAPNGAARRSGPFAMPPPESRLRLNPLLQRSADGAWRPAWPSRRYEEEYAPASGYLGEAGTVTARDVDQAAAGAWSTDPRLVRLARLRVLVDLPARW